MEQEIRVREFEVGQEVYLPDEEYAELFGDMCNLLWYLTHPGFPRDGFHHTSDVCRRLAFDALNVLGIKEG
jgi:hypothetical protein